VRDGLPFQLGVGPSVIIPRVAFVHGKIRTSSPQCRCTLHIPSTSAARHYRISRVKVIRQYRTLVVFHRPHFSLESVRRLALERGDLVSGRYAGGWRDTQLESRSGLPGIALYGGVDNRSQRCSAGIDAQRGYALRGPAFLLAQEAAG